jgi:hypothetical protein
MTSGPIGSIMLLMVPTYDAPPARHRRANGAGPGSGPAPQGDVPDRLGRALERATPSPSDRPGA